MSGTERLDDDELDELIDAGLRHELTWAEVAERIKPHLTKEEAEVFGPVAEEPTTDAGPPRSRRAAEVPW